MYIYLLTNGTHYKIGKSKNPEKRVKQLQTGSSEEIILLYKYYSPKYCNIIETSLHHTYKHSKKILEWFLLDNKEVINFMKDCLKIEKNLLHLKDNKI